MTEAQISYMVNRFLMFKFPETMSPDGGFTLIRPRKPSGELYEHGPTGTNLLSAMEARVMVEHMLEGMPEE